MTLPIQEVETETRIQILTNSFSGDIKIKLHTEKPEKINYIVSDSAGTVVLTDSFQGFEKAFQLSKLPFGLYIISVQDEDGRVISKKILYSDK